MSENFDSCKPGSHKWHWDDTDRAHCEWCKETIKDPCRAILWDGSPAYEGPHKSHHFVYGPFNEWMGTCTGRP